MTIFDAADFSAQPHSRSIAMPQERLGCVEVVSRRKQVMYVLAAMTDYFISLLRDWRQREPPRLLS